MINDDKPVDDGLCLWCGGQDSMLWSPTGKGCCYDCAKDEPVAAWVTRNALTSGIAKVQGIARGGILTVTDGDLSGFHFFGDGDNWHRTHAGAVKRARSMIREKRAGLLRELAELDAREVALDVSLTTIDEDGPSETKTCED